MEFFDTFGFVVGHSRDRGSIPGGRKRLFFSAKRRHLWELLVQCAPTAVTARTKRPGRDSQHTSPSNAEVKRIIGTVTLCLPTALFLP